MRSSRTVSFATGLITLLLATLASTLARAERRDVPIDRGASRSERGAEASTAPPTTLTKMRGPFTWIQVHDLGSTCPAGVPNTGGRGTGAPDVATWCFDAGASNNCSSTTLYSGGLPGCWTHYDASLLANTPNAWHVSTYDTYVPGTEDSSMWCGEGTIDQVCSEENWAHPPGYGADYYHSMIIDLGTPGAFDAAQGFEIQAVHLYSVEWAHDYCVVQIGADIAPGSATWFEVARFTGVSNPDETNCRGYGQSYWGTVSGPSPIGDGTSPYLCADWEPLSIQVSAAQVSQLSQGAGDNLYIRWLVVSDEGFDDQTGGGGLRADTRGAWRVDHIAVGGNSGSYFPPDVVPPINDVVDFENNGCPGGNPVCEPGRDQILTDVIAIPRAELLNGFWNVSSWVSGTPVTTDLWHLTNTPTYLNQGKSCNTSNVWVWASNLTNSGIDGNIERTRWHMRLVSPEIDVSPTNPYTGAPVNGVLIEYDDYLCAKSVSADAADTKMRRYRNGCWEPWEGDGFVEVGGCLEWEIDRTDDWSSHLSDDTEKVQFAFDFFDMCDYTANTPQYCMPGVLTPNPHRKNTYIVDNISIGLYDESTPKWSVDVQALFQDTFERGDALHSAGRENSELGLAEWDSDDSVSITVSDPDGLFPGPGGHWIFFRVSIDCGTTWSHEPNRPQGSNDPPVGAWFFKEMNFSEPAFANPPPGREFDGTYRTVIVPADLPANLRNGNQFFAGTVVEYYFDFCDVNAVCERFPPLDDERLTFDHDLWDDERQDPWPFEVTVLPCHTAADYADQGGYGILLVNDWYLGNSYDAEVAPSQEMQAFPRTSQLFEEALRDMGLKFDRYDNNASQAVSPNGPGIIYETEPTDANGFGGIRDPGSGAHRYNGVIWSVGSDNASTLTDASQTELVSYLASTTSDANLWLAGRNLCEDESMSGIVEAFNGGNFWINYVGASLISGGCADGSGVSVPTKSTMYLEGVNDCLYDQYEEYGIWYGCPVKDLPDDGFVMSVSGFGTETLIFQFDNIARALNKPAGIRCRQAGAQANTAVTTIWDPGMVTTRSARGCLTLSILSDLGLPVLPSGSIFTPTTCACVCCFGPGQNPVDVSDDEAIPRRFALEQNHPNPFNPLTTIRYSLPRDKMRVQLAIFDTSGRRIRTLVDKLQSGPSHEVAWDGKDDGDEPVVSGVYFYRLDADDLTATKRLVLLK